MPLFFSQVSNCKVPAPGCKVSLGNDVARLVATKKNAKCRTLPLLLMSVCCVDFFLLIYVVEIENDSGYSYPASNQAYVNRR